MIVAFDKFGNFTGIQYMQSSSTDIYPNTPTFTFVGATYTSNYVAFVTVEQTDRNEVPLQTATPAETSLLNTYDTSSGSIPFVDFANQYTLTGSQYLPSALAGRQLDPNRVPAQHPEQRLRAEHRRGRQQDNLRRLQDRRRHAHRASARRASRSC